MSCRLCAELACTHPPMFRLWPSNWQWRCELCKHVEDVPEGAVGVIRKQP